MRHAADETSLLERIEHRGHAAGRDDEAIGDDTRFERLTGAFDDGKCLFGSAGQAVVIPCLSIVQADQLVTGANEVGVALSGKPIGPRVFVFEVVVDDDERLQEPVSS